MRQTPSVTNGGASQPHRSGTTGTTKLICEINLTEGFNEGIIEIGDSIKFEGDLMHLKNGIRDSMKSRKSFPPITSNQHTSLHHERMKIGLF